jgi:hypothetical protein
VIFRDSGFVRDPALARGLRNDGFVKTIVGTWPDSAWLVSANPHEGNWSFNVYRWRLSRWEHVLDVPPGSVGRGFSIGAWRGGVFGRIDDDDAAGPPKVKIVRLDGGPPPTFAAPPRKSQDCYSEWVHVPEVLATGDGDLFAFGDPCDSPDGLTTILERWLRSANKPEIFPVLSPGLGSPSRCYASKVVALDRGLAALGSCGNGEVERPYLARFDGQVWAEISAPEVRGEAVGYTHDASGEWLVTGSNHWSQNKGNTLLRRTAGNEWETITLPQRPGARSEGAEVVRGPFDPNRLVPLDVKSVGPDTWVVAYARGVESSERVEGVLLRTRPVEEPFVYTEGP